MSPEDILRDTPFYQWVLKKHANEIAAARAQGFAEGLTENFVKIFATGSAKGKERTKDFAETFVQAYVDVFPEELAMEHAEKLEPLRTVLAHSIEQHFPSLIPLAEERIPLINDLDQLSELLFTIIDIYHQAGDQARQLLLESQLDTTKQK